MTRAADGLRLSSTVRYSFVRGSGGAQAPAVPLHRQRTRRRLVDYFCPLARCSHPLPLPPLFLHRVSAQLCLDIERFRPLSWPPQPVLGVLSHGRRQTVRRLWPLLAIDLLYSVCLLLLRPSWLFFASPQTDCPSRSWYLGWRAIALQRN